VASFVGLRRVVSKFVVITLPVDLPSSFQVEKSCGRNPALCMAGRYMSVNSNTFAMTMVTHIWLQTGMRSLVDIEVCLLVETLGTVLNFALISLLAILRFAAIVLMNLLSELGSSLLSRNIRSAFQGSLYVRRGTRCTY
jgi:hypothetical protein